MVDISAAGRGSSGGQIMKEEPLLFPWLMDNVQLPAGSTPAPRDFRMEVGMNVTG